LARQLAALLLAIALGACSGDAPPPADVSPEPATVESEPRLPPPPVRAALDSRYLPSDIYEAICRLGKPVLVKGWPRDPSTRFVYFAGPFRLGVASQSWDYLYMSLDAPGRRRVMTTLRLPREHIGLDYAKPKELPTMQGMEADITRVQQSFGWPALVRDLPSGEQRFIFDRKICLGEQLLEGMYLDVDDGQVVRARGIEHPLELKWILSDGRPPGPDPVPTWSIDVEPAEASPQAAAVGFVRRRENLGPAAARELLWQDQIPQSDLRVMIQPSLTGARLDEFELNFQTTRYGLEETHITVRFQVYDEAQIRFPIEDRLVLRKRDDHWLVVHSHR
jgi:hypothetical protein